LSEPSREASPAPRTKLGRDGGLAANQGFLPANGRLVLNPVLDQAVILGKLVHRGAEVHPALAVGAGPRPSPTVRSGRGREEKSNLTQRTSVLPVQIRGLGLPVTRRWSRKVRRDRTIGYGDARIRHRKLVESSRAGHTRLRPGLLRSEEHTSELQSRENLVCRLLLEKKKASPQQRRQ